MYVLKDKKNLHWGPTTNFTLHFLMIKFSVFKILNKLSALQFFSEV